MGGFLRYLDSINEYEQIDETKSSDFEAKITRNIRKFFEENQKKYDFLDGIMVEHSIDDRFNSDIVVQNNDDRVWIETKLNKYANYGSTSFKYENCEWTCDTGSDSLLDFILSLLKEHSSDFINFCKEKLGDDFSLPTDCDKVMKSWKIHGGIDDTDNDVYFITDKIEIEDFGKRISDFYINNKEERTYYIQIADELFILDPEYNPLGLKTHDGKPLRTFEETHRRGRIQFRAKRLSRKLKSGETKDFYSITTDVKILSDKENELNDEEYVCSFDSVSKFPILDITGNGDISDEGQQKQADGQHKAGSDTVEPGSDNEAREG